MKRIGIVIPYFGQLPDNIISFLISCKWNKQIHWFIFTNDSKYKKLNNFCNNVSFIKSSLNDIRKRLVTVTGIKDIVLNHPYKLCDYKPLYGKIFSQYLKNYDYWGYSDIDVVYGDLMKFIKDGISLNFPKIGIHGHFTLIRNLPKFNNLYKLPIIKNNRKNYLFKDIVSQSPKGYAFDEQGGLNTICRQYHISTYTNKHLVNDIIFPNLDLNTNDLDKYKSCGQAFIWYKGHDYFYYTHFNKIKRCEYGYYHFQKRHVFNKFIYDKDVPIFYGYTNGYGKIFNLNRDSILYCMKRNKSSFIKRLSYKLYMYCFTNLFANRIHIGKLRIPIKYILKSIFVNHDFRIFKI